MTLLRVLGIDSYTDKFKKWIRNKFIAKGDLKTINGEPIEGEGDIEIKGGSGDSPIVEGEVENSAIFKGEVQTILGTYKNRAISQTAIALGGNTISGLKGYYITYADFETNELWLHNERPNLDDALINIEWTKKSSTEENKCLYKVGKYPDTVSIICNGRYYNCGDIEYINGNVITLSKDLPFTRDDVKTVRSNTIAGITTESGLVPINRYDELTLFVISKPDVGPVDLGGTSLAEGLDSKAIGGASHAEGYQTVAYGKYSHTEGYQTEAGYRSHAEGYMSKATGENSHTEGRENESIGNCSHAEGRGTSAVGNQTHAEGYNTSANGENSHAEGNSVISDGVQSHAEGFETHTIGEASHAEGMYTTSKGKGAHAEGFETHTIGEASHAEGMYTTSKGKGAHAEGNYTIAEGDYSHAEGRGNDDGTYGAFGWASHSEGYETKTEGSGSHAEGHRTSAIGDFSHAENDRTTAEGKSSHAEGCGTIAEGAQSHAEGLNTKASGPSAHAEGEENIAGGDCSHVEGYLNETTKTGVHIEGTNNSSDAVYSHVEGINNTTSGPYSHVEGIGTSVVVTLKSAIPENAWYEIQEDKPEWLANNDRVWTNGFGELTVKDTNGTAKWIKLSRLIGIGNNAIISAVIYPEGRDRLVRAHAIGSHSEGVGTITNNIGESAVGRFNESDSDTLFSIGIGTSENDRKNALEVKQNGDIYIEGVEGRIQDKLNVGIDPVVWKYIMNPCIIKKGEKIPDDLLDENNNLKYDMHPNMYRVRSANHGYLSIGGPNDIIDGHGNGVLEECAPGYDVWFSTDGYWDNEV